MKNELANLVQEIGQCADRSAALWAEYAKQQGGVDLKRMHVTMWDGCSERMDRLICRNNQAILVDQFGKEWSLLRDGGVTAILELNDIVFGNQSPSEE